MFKKDSLILSTTLILIIIGIFTLSSAAATALSTPELFFQIITYQVIAILAGFFVSFLILKSKKINYITIKQKSPYLFLVALLTQLAVLVPGLGIYRKGATRWLDLGIQVQPSEFFRFAFILFLANILFSFQKELNTKLLFKYFATGLLLISAFYFYIHDKGSLFILLISVFVMFMYTKFKRIAILGFLSLILLASLFLVFNGDYAKKRLLTYYNSIFHTERLDKNNEFYQNYNMLQAVGSGGVFGVGYGASIQKFNKRLPEPVSDSIFSIFAEEWGFVFSSILIILYMVLAWEIFSIVLKTKNFFQKLVIVGLGTNLIFPAFYNIYAVLGLVPLSGIPLTFISKGGTSIFFSIISVAIIILFSKKK